MDNLPDSGSIPLFTFIYTIRASEYKSAISSLCSISENNLPSNSEVLSDHRKIRKRKEMAFANLLLCILVLALLPARLFLQRNIDFSHQWSVFGIAALTERSPCKPFDEFHDRTSSLLSSSRVFAHQYSIQEDLFILRP